MDIAKAVQELADQGKNPTEISKALHISAQDIFIKHNVAFQCGYRAFISRNDALGAPRPGRPKAWTPVPGSEDLPYYQQLKLAAEAGNLRAKQLYENIVRSRKLRRENRKSTGRKPKYASEEDRRIARNLREAERRRRIREWALAGDPEAIEQLEKLRENSRRYQRKLKRLAKGRDDAGSKKT